MSSCCQISSRSQIVFKIVLFDAYSLVAYSFETFRIFICAQSLCCSHILTQVVLSRNRPFMVFGQHQQQQQPREKLSCSKKLVMQQITASFKIFRYKASTRRNNVIKTINNRLECQNYGQSTSIQCLNLSPKLILDLHTRVTLNSVRVVRKRRK